MLEASDAEGEGLQDAVDKLVRDPTRMPDADLQALCELAAQRQADAPPCAPPLLGNAASALLLSKRLVLDVTAVLPRLARAAPIFAPGSNFEALAFGPPGPRGERTVVLMSDDNLRATQTTAFLWLALP